MRSVACALMAAAALGCASASNQQLGAEARLASILQKPAHLRHGLTGSAMLGIAQQMRISDDAASAVQTFYFDQELDHFDPTSNGTYQQRYFVNTQFWNNTADAPVFLYVGGEGMLTFKPFCASALHLFQCSCPVAPCDCWRRHFRHGTGTWWPVGWT